MTTHFTALPLPAEVAAHLADRLTPPPEGVRPGPRSQWHITLAHYGGDADPERCLRLVAEAAPRHRPVRLRLAGQGRFVGDERTVVYAAVGGDLDALHALAGDLGRKKEARPYVPHATLAMSPHPEAWDPGLGGYAGPEWTAEEVVLYASDQGRYTRLGVVPLAP